MASNCYSVLVAGVFDRAFSYSSHEILSRGQIVCVPVRNRHYIGICMGEDDGQFSGTLKEIDASYPFVLSEDFLHFLERCAEYTCHFPAQFVDITLLSRKSYEIAVKKLTRESNFAEDDSGDTETMLCDISLTDEQNALFEQIMSVDDCVHLLRGVTGSGKTELYLRVAYEYARHAQVLILVPEIMLTQQLIQRIERYFHVEVNVWHSKVSEAKRRNVWLHALSGRSGLYIASRSGLFLPFRNLRLLVVDEEHDSSYKQESGVIYHARDMAILRGSIDKCKVLLVSATPSVESYVNVQMRGYRYHELENRFADASMPQVHLIDMKQERRDFLISSVLMCKLQEAMFQKKQSMLFLNRRGYSRSLFCKACGKSIMCPFCSVSMCYHMHLQKVLCHYCGESISTLRCSCGSDDFALYGIGIERVYDEACKRLPDAKICMASSDFLNTVSRMEEFFATVDQYDIIIATQILAKGHHLPRLSLVGVLDGDGKSSDIRANERLFQLMTQVAGRAGREHNISGDVYIQAYDVEDPLWSLLPDFHAFMSHEISFRQEALYPPFARLMGIIISGPCAKKVEEYARGLASKLSHPGVRVLGPSPASIYLLRGKYRWRLLLQGSSKAVLAKLLHNRQWLLPHQSQVHVSIDVDPINFL